MRSILTIFRKELTDTLRDRRTITSMIVIPLLLYPLLIGILVKVQISLAEKAASRRLRVAVVRGERAPGLLAALAVR